MTEKEMRHSQLPLMAEDDGLLYGADRSYVGTIYTPADTALVLACVNACHRVNPANPLAAAEAYEGMVAKCALVESVLRAVSINPSIAKGVRFDNMANDLRAALSAARKGVEK